MDGGFAAGGSGVLAGLIDEHGEALVPDLLHYYGVDIRDLFCEEAPLSPRYVLALVSHLPLDSAFSASCRGGPEFRCWDTDRYLLVGVLNTLRSIQHMYVLTHLGKNAPKPRAPEPFPVPDDNRTTDKRKPKAGSFAFIAAAKLAAARRRKAGQWQELGAQRSGGSPSELSQT